MPDVLKIADLAMLSLTETQKGRLKEDMKEILAAGESLTRTERAVLAGTAVSFEDLREDTAEESPDAPKILSLSKKQRDGYIVVSRTVGGTV